jgi:hypothetical protein
MSAPMFEQVNKSVICKTGSAMNGLNKRGLNLTYLKRVEVKFRNVMKREMGNGKLANMTANLQQLYMLNLKI